VSKKQDAPHRDDGNSAAGAPPVDAAAQPEPGLGGAGAEGGTATAGGGPGAQGDGTPTAGGGPGAQGDGTAAPGGGQGIATAITEVSERAALLVHEEIELAKAEVAEKASKLVKGAIVGMAAGIFIVTALFFVLIGLAWLLYYYLPIGSQFTYFWGFFAMAVILLALGLIAGLVAGRAVKRGSPPTPNMAIEEARKIRETVSSGADAPEKEGS
jgi:uncharacterized membrane protein YqjE